MNGFGKKAIAGVAGLALLAGVLGASLAGTVLAADPTPTPTLGWQRGVGPGGGLMGGMRGAGGPGMMGRFAGGPAGYSIIGVLTEKLGLTAEEIQTQRQAGKSLAEIAATKGMDEVTLVKTVLEGHRTALAERVTAGQITQAQADEALTWMEARITENVQRTTVGPNRPDGMPGAGMGFGRGGCGGTGVGAAIGGGPGAMGRWGARTN